MRNGTRSAARALALAAGILGTLAGCSDDPRRGAPITADHCAAVAPVRARLADLTAPFAREMAARTGVLPLEDGELAMVSRAWLSEAAERSIDIQYFIFSPDNIGLIAVDHLLRAAERGVQVRMLVDDVMVEAGAEELLVLDAHPNLDIRIYNPTTNIGKRLPEKLLSLATDFRGFNQRMHNKTFIVDGQVVITGGRNIADEYFDYDHAYNFRDRDVLLLGGTVAEVQRSFDEFWDDALSVPIGGAARATIAEAAEAAVVAARDTATAYTYLHRYACDPANFRPEVRERIRDFPTAFAELQARGTLTWVDRVEFVSDAPGKNSGTAGLGGGGASTDALVALIRGAQHSISIESPYLITTEVGQSLFREAIARGVTVRILTNSLASTDNLEAFSGHQRARAALLGMGVLIHEFRPDAQVRLRAMTDALPEDGAHRPIFGLHSKSMVVDDAIAVIGTFNLDPRSANLNTECLAIIHDVRVAGELARVMAMNRAPENAWATSAAFNPDHLAGWKKRYRAWTRRLVPRAIL